MGVVLAIIAIAAVMLVLALIGKGVDRVFRPLERRAQRSDAARRLERARKDSRG